MFLTIEDPVEYIVKGARQLKIGPKMGFDEAIRGILRHDPDIVLVGEMRDKITAETAIKMANTGHLVFSTLHTNDAPSAIARLFKMGIEPFLLAYAINVIVAQRLIRTLCKICKKPMDSSEKKDLVEIRSYRRRYCHHILSIQRLDAKNAAAVIKDVLQSMKLYILLNQLKILFLMQVIKLTKMLFVNKQ